MTLSLTISGACVMEVDIRCRRRPCVFHMHLAGLGVDGEQVGVERSHEQRVAEDGEARD